MPVASFRVHLGSLADFRVSVTASVRSRAGPGSPIAISSDPAPFTSFSLGGPQTQALGLEDVARIGLYGSLEVRSWAGYSTSSSLSFPLFKVVPPL